MAELWQLFLLPVTTPTEILVGGTIDFYYPGTIGESNRKNVWLDSGATTLAANPYTLDSDAGAKLFGTGAYHVVIKDVNGNVEHDFDYISASGANIPGVITSVDTIADLRAFDVTSGTKSIQPLGYSGANDGGGGPARSLSEGYAPGTYVDNGTDVIVPDGGDGSAAWVWGWPGAVDLHWGGATGDGVTDDTVAIKRVFDNHSSICGKGTFIIAPTSPGDIILPLNASKRIFGARDLTIKIQSGSGSFRAITGNTGDVDLSNLVIDGVIFDHTASNNAPVNLADLQAYPRVTAMAFTGSNMVFKNCIVRDEISINTVSFNGINVSDCRIVDNDFFEIGVGSDTLLNDHSTIYTNGHNMIISRNNFKAATWATATAIETHGGLSIVSNNAIYKYLKGMNITGITPLDTELTNITNNVMDVAISGISLWSYKYQLHTTGYGIENMLVSNNNIRIRQLTSGYSGGSNISGITIDPNSDMPIKALKVFDNCVEFEQEDALPAYPGNSYTIGIGAYVTDAGFEMVDCDFLRNTVKNAPVAGVRLTGFPVTNCSIENNTIHNAGQSVDPAINSAFKLPIFATPTDITGFLRIKNNHIIDDFDVTRIAAVMYLNCAAPLKNIETGGNKVTILGDGVAFTRSYVLPNPPPSPPRILGDVFDKFIAPIRSCLAGSYVKDLANGLIWSLHNTGTNWVPTGENTDKPIFGVFPVSTYIRNSKPLGAVRGWISSVAGGAYSTTRASTTLIDVGVWAKWDSGTTVWECTTEGTTDASSPSIVGLVVGDTVVDGTVVWTMRSLTSAVWVNDSVFTATTPTVASAIAGSPIGTDAAVIDEIKTLVNELRAALIAAGVVV